MLTDNTQAKLMERKVCFISDASTGVGGVVVCRHLSKGQFPSPDKPGVRAFIDRVEEGCSMQKQHSHLQKWTPNWSSVVWPASSWLVQIQLLCSSKMHLFPLLCGQFSELWQLMSWVQSGHLVVNFSNWCFGVCKTLTGHDSECYL